MSKKYTYEYSGDDDTGYFIMDPDGESIATVLDGGDVDLLVEHLNEPMYGGGYTIEDPEESDDEGEQLYALLDPDGDDILYDESRSVLEGLVSHLNRMQ